MSTMTINGKLAPLADDGVEVPREPDDHQEQDEEPGVVDRDPDSPDVKQSHRAPHRHGLILCPSR